jgi:4-aminobutyrate aminotransferase/(S)-3-amino-2-methylpropionate transaminase
MIAVELVQAGTAEPAPELAKAVATACHQQGIVVLTCGTYGNVLRFLPPLTISDELLVEALEIVVASLREIS